MEKLGEINDLSQGSEKAALEAVSRDKEIDNTGMRRSSKSISDGTAEISGCGRA
jgi:hypothetical protein